MSETRRKLRGRYSSERRWKRHDYFYIPQCGIYRFWAPSVLDNASQHPSDRGGKGVKTLERRETDVDCPPRRLQRDTGMNVPQCSSRYGPRPPCCIALMCAYTERFPRAACGLIASSTMPVDKRGCAPARVFHSQAFKTVVPQRGLTRGDVRKPHIGRDLIRISVLVHISTLRPLHRGLLPTPGRR